MQVALRYLLAFVRRGNQPCSKWLAENEKIARLCPALCQDALGMHHSCDGKTVLWLLIGNRMPARNDSSCLCDDIRASTQNLAQNGIIQVIRPGNQVNGHQDLTSHGVHIAQGVGSGNRSKYIGVINDRWKEICRANDGLCI